MVYLQIVGQGQGVQFSQLHHSMTNVKSTKHSQKYFALTLTVSEIFTFEKLMEVRDRHYTAAVESSMAGHYNGPSRWSHDHRKNDESQKELNRFSLFWGQIEGN